MSALSALRALAQRCVAAHAPDRRLDEDIAVAALGWRLWQSKHGYWNIAGPNSESATVEGSPPFGAMTGQTIPHIAPGGWGDGCGIPEFTASVDAALSLVPTGYDWIIEHVNGGLTIRARVGHNDPDRALFGDSAALALCAAALLARAEALAVLA